MLGRVALSRSWPRGEIDLLLRAIISPLDEARRAWATWTARRVFDDVTWPEIRLLGPLSVRLPEIDAGSSLLPRVGGIAKRFWTETQLRIRETAEVFDTLDLAGIPFLVFKGGAQYAEGLAPSSRRIMGDVDILVPRAQIATAVEALTDTGWASVNGESPEYLRFLATVRLSGNYRKGRFGEIDLHGDLFHYARRDPDADESLWARTNTRLLGTRLLRVPDPTDSVLIALAHASVGRGGDWAVDIHARTRAQRIDWDRLAETAARRGLATSCLAGLVYLNGLGVPVPSEILRELERSGAGLGERLKHWSNIRDRAERNVVEKSVNAIANRLLKRRGFSYFLKDTTLVTVRRPTLPFKWLFAARDASTSLPAGWGRRHDVVIANGGRASGLLLALDINRPPRRRRIFFDVMLGGRPLARLRSRSRGRPGTERRMLFAFGVTGLEAGTLSVVSRPTGFLPPDAADEERARIEALDFRLGGVWFV